MCISRQPRHCLGFGLQTSNRILFDRLPGLIIRNLFNILRVDTFFIFLHLTISYARFRYVY